MSSSFKQNSRDAARVVTALAEVGVNVSSIWDLVNSRTTPEKAIPSLVRLLPDVRETKVKEAIVRALSVRQARGKGVAEILIREIHQSRGNELLGWAIGNAISVVITEDDNLSAELEGLLLDEGLGKARQMLTDALVRIKDPEAVPILLRVLDQPDLTGHTLHALGKLRASEARVEIEKYLESENAWIRKEARRALSAIEKSTH